MNINYEHYKVFYYVAYYGSFTKAATALFANQPNITRTIAHLESQLGCRLFQRGHRGVTLTPEGELLFNHVRIAHEQLQTAEAEIADTVALRTGTVTIGTTEMALNLFLLDRLKEFRDRYPNIRLRLRNHITPLAISALKQEQIDLCIVTTPAPTDDSDLAVTTLMKFQEILVCGTDYADLAASKRKYRLRELQQYPLIMLSRDTMTYGLFSEWYLSHGARLNVDTEAATADHVLSMVEHNLGLGFVPRPWADASLKAGRIHEVPLTESVPDREVILVCNNARTPGAAATEFIRFLRESSLQNSLA